MTEAEHLLILLAEECNEVAQRASKAIRFGLDEIQPGQQYTNKERIGHELADLVAIVDLLRVADLLPAHLPPGWIAVKKNKVRTFAAYSRQCGIIQKGDELV